MVARWSGHVELARYEASLLGLELALYSSLTRPQISYLTLKTALRSKISHRFQTYNRIWRNHDLRIRIQKNKLFPRSATPARRMKPDSNWRSNLDPENPNLDPQYSSTPRNMGKTVMAEKDLVLAKLKGGKSTALLFLTCLYISVSIIVGRT